MQEQRWNKLVIKINVRASIPLKLHRCCIYKQIMKCSSLARSKQNSKAEKKLTQKNNPLVHARCKQFFLNKCKLQTIDVR